VRTTSLPFSSAADSTWNSRPSPSTLAQVVGEEAELLRLRLVELHAEHPVDAALQVEAEPQALVGQQRARDAHRSGARLASVRNAKEAP
jgi:hypothetical protein